MTKLLIENLDDKVVAAIDARAAQKGRSRSEEARQLLIAATDPLRIEEGQSAGFIDHLLALGDLGFDFEPVRNRTVNPNRAVSFE